ncbi:MAG: hypothetical protein FJ316_05515 [SAR202 cluster bacterium]|nr:hypothetical protein [SAR202 cluster bacterium]
MNRTRLYIGPSLLSARAVVMLTIALACGPANPGQPRVNPPTAAPASSGGDSSESAEFNTLAKGKAPGGLSGLQLPDTSETVFAAFQKLPVKISGKTFHNYYTPSSASTNDPYHQATYGEKGPYGYPLHIAARNVYYLTHYLENPQVTGDVSARTGEWTAGQWIADIVKKQKVQDEDLELGETLEVLSSGRDDSLGWVRFTIKSYSLNDPNLFAIVQGVLWGSEKGNWIFTILADSQEDADLMLEAFAGAAKGKPVAVSTTPYPADAEYGGWQVATPAPPSLQKLQAKAPPGSLQGLKLPSTDDAIKKAFQAMPNQVAGLNINDPSRTGAYGPRNYWVQYSVQDRPGQREVRLELRATGITPGLNYPPNWTAGHIVAYAQTDEYHQTYDIIEERQAGKEGTLVWFTYVSKLKTGDFTPDGRPLYKVKYVMSWGEEAGTTVFSATGDTPAGRDALVAAFAAAVGK